MSAAAHAQGQSGTTLSAEKTATGFYERRIQYTWTLNKSVAPAPTVEIGSGVTQQFIYAIDTFRIPSQTDTFGVRGVICVTNGGAVATAELTIVDVVQSKTGSGQFHDVIAKPVDLTDRPQLDPGETHCYPYEITSPGPIPLDTLFRNQARVTITNHSGHITDPPTPFGPSPNAGFSLPTSPSLTVIDESATVTDAETCPAGFTCVSSHPDPFPFQDSGREVFTKAITNRTAACDSTFALVNTVTLETNDTATHSTANAVAGITTPVCPLPLPIVGCTHTIGFWMTHPADWPVTTLTLGSVSYDQSQLLQILSQPPRGNGLVQLARQLIAAKLSVATGATTPAGVANDITIADTLIGNLVVPPVGAGYLAPGITSGLVTDLDTYNNGLAEGGAPHCDETTTP
jgi:ferredoxin